MEAVVVLAGGSFADARGGLLILNGAVAGYTNLLVDCTNLHIDT